MEIQWPLVFYTVLSAIGCGAFAFVAISELLDRWDVIRSPLATTALGALIFGGLSSFLHLSHPERIFKGFGNLASGITQEMILTILTILVIFLYVVVIRKKNIKTWRLVLALVGLVLAVAFLFSLGKAYMMPARPAWNTWLVPLISLVTGAVMGSFTLYLWAAYKTPQKDEAGQIAGINKIAFFTLVAQAVAIALYFVYILTSPAVGAATFFNGDLNLILWVGVVLVGLLIPIGLTVWIMVSRPAISPLTVAVSCLICVLVGGIAFRSAYFLLGGLAPLFF